MSPKSKRKILRWSSVSIILLIFTLTMASIAYASTLYWTTKAPMPTSRARMSSGGVVNGKIYVLGGTGSSSILSTVEMYDPATNSWTPKNALTAPRFAAACATVGSNIYVIGGIGSSGITNTILRYDTTGNAGNGSCSQIGTLNQARGTCQAAVLNGMIYVVGGMAAGVTLDTIEEIDPNTGVSTIKATRLPAPRELSSVVAANNKLYIMGGFNNNAPTTTCWEYDPQGAGGAGTFASKTAMISPRGGVNGVSLSNGKIYVCGGATAMPPSSWTLDVQEFDPLGAGGAGSWNIVGSIPTSRFAFECQVVNNQIYIIGGNNSVSDLNTNECASLQTDQSQYSITFSSTGNKSVSCGSDGTLMIDFPAGTSIIGNELLRIGILNSGPGTLTATPRSRYFDISTTAGLSGSAMTIKVPFNPATVTNTANLKLYHWNGNSWVDVTTSVDNVNNMVIGTVSSLSPFVVGETSSSSLVPASSTWSLALMGLVGFIMLVRILNRRKAASA